MTIFMWQCYLIDMSSQNMNGTFTALTLPNHRCCYKTGQPIRNWSIRYSSFQIHEMKEQQLPLILPNCLVWLFDYLKKKACVICLLIPVSSHLCLGVYKDEGMHPTWVDGFAGDDYLCYSLVDPTSTVTLDCGRGKHVAELILKFNSFPVDFKTGLNSAADLP